MNYNKKSIEDIEVAGKRVLCRCDFNVPTKGGVITSDKRIVAALPTIKYLIENKAKVILCSHMGKPKGEWKPELSLKIVAERISQLLGQEAPRDVLDDVDVAFYGDFKELNEEAQNEGITTSNVKNIRTLLHYLTIKNYITKEENRDSFSVNRIPSLDLKRLMDKFERRIEICRFILGELYSKATPDGDADAEKKPVEFSLVGLFKAYQAVPRMEVSDIPVALSDVEDALLYLSKIGALKLEGGFLVLYNGMEIKRIVKDNRIKYKVDDYRLLDEFYKQKIRQIHIVGEYANLMVRDYNAALQFVQDYFNMDFKKFIATYFKGERAKEI